MPEGAGVGARGGLGAVTWRLGVSGRGRAAARRGQDPGRGPSPAKGCAGVGRPRSRRRRRQQEQEEAEVEEAVAAEGSRGRAGEAGAAGEGVGALHTNTLVHTRRRAVAPAAPGRGGRGAARLGARPGSGGRMWGAGAAPRRRQEAGRLAAREVPAEGGRSRAPGRNKMRGQAEQTGPGETRALGAPSPASPSRVRD